MKRNESIHKKRHLIKIRIYEVINLWVSFRRRDVALEYKSPVDGVEWRDM